MYLCIFIKAYKSTQSPRWKMVMFTLVSYGKEHLCSRLSEHITQDGAETVRGWEGTL